MSIRSIAVCRTYLAEGNTMTRLTMGALALLFLGLAQPPGDVGAAEIKVLSTGNMVNILTDLTSQFERATGHKLVIEYGSVVLMRNRIRSGEVADLTINERPELEELRKQGRIATDTIVDIARSPFGVAVRAGAPKPDISTAEGFKQAMLNAKSIGHSNGGTGPYNTRLFQKLGIYDQIKDKIKIIQGKPVAVAVADGEVEIGIQQTNVIQPVAGTQYLGPLPPDLIEYGHFGVAVRNVSKNQDVARELIKFMTSPEAAALLRKTAMEPPER